jgi:hypothetical protein
MGQYHYPVCIEAEEGLSPHGMDSGLKEGEQGFSRPSTPNAIVALICARGGNGRSSAISSPSATIKPMTTKDKLISRLQNWKFVQAMSYADDLPENLRQVLVRLSDLWGDTGFSRGGVFEIVLEYTVSKLIGDINTLPD